MGQFAIQWRILQSNFVDNGDTRDSIYNAFLFGGSSPQLVNLILSYCGNILADGILVSAMMLIEIIPSYSSYNLHPLAMALLLYVWSLTTLLICPIVLLHFWNWWGSIHIYKGKPLNDVYDKGLAIASTVLQGKTLFQPGYDSPQTELIGSIVDGTMSVVTAVTTVLGTFIICRRIISSTDTDILPDRRYVQVIRILIESASLYSVTTIFFAIADFLSLAEDSGNIVTIFGLQNYLTALAITATVSPLTCHLTDTRY